MRELTDYPKVSVCIPCRNGEKELPHTLANLLVRSDYPRDRFEVVVGDHGSTDGTAQLLAARGREAPTLRRVAVEYDGPNRAKVRNALAREASGDLLIFIDHDVLVSRSFISAHVAAHRAFPGALVAGVTYGKGAFRLDIDHVLAQLDLDDISTSHDFLASSRELADMRSKDLPTVGREPQDVRHYLCPSRFFWTCNVSMTRADLEECGGYDERYVGWGLEDDDFACAFHVRERPLVFSNQPWAFHIPHPADTGLQMLSWRRNYDHLLTKYPSRELEYFHVAPYGIDQITAQVELSIRCAAAIDVGDLVAELANHLSKPSGSRLGLFLLDPAVAETLMVSEAFIPTRPLGALPTAVAGIKLWSLIGTKAPVPSKSFDETVLIADQLMVLDDYALGLVLLECSRISRRVVVGAGRHCLAPTSSFAAKKFFEKLSQVKFDECVVVGPARALFDAHR